MRRMISGLSAAAVLTLALPALAVPPPDTALTHGYDEDNTTLVFGVSDYDDENPTDGCAGVEGEFDYTLDDTGAIDSYESTDAPISDDTTTTTAAADDSVDGIECELNPVDVTGPNGQVNHGTVVSSFVHALKDLDIRGRGCLIRVIAQSGYGKGDQQIKTSDVDQDAGTDEEPVLGGTVTLETALTKCADKGNKPDKADDDTKGKPKSAGDSADKGKPDHAGPPADKGKPDDAGKPENPGNSGKSAKPENSGNGKKNK